MRSAFDEARNQEAKRQFQTTPSNWSGYQDIKAKGGFNSPPATVDFGSLWQGISGAANKIGQAIQSFGQPAPTPVPQPRMSMDEAVQQMVNKGWKVVNPSSTPTPISTPVNPSVNPNDFKFQMGQKDYSYVRPQLQKLFQAKNNPPIAQYLDEFIKAGNQYGVDPRVLITIANNESSLGKRYPEQSFNPFGYLVDVPAVPPGATGAERERAIWQGLQNAGFTSMPHAIDRLTERFARQPYEGYRTFYQDPTISNLQLAYNANAGERANYLTNAADLLQYFQNQQMLGMK